MPSGIYKRTEETKRILSLAKLGSIKLENRNKKHHNWKGDNASVKAIHVWVKRRKIKPKSCDKCNKIKRLDLSNNGHTYRRNLTDYEWLCRSCHLLKDRHCKKWRKE